MAKVEDQDRNLAGQEFFPVESIEVLEYCPLPNGEGEPTEVHLWLKIEGAESTPFAIRFHSPRTVDELIVALMTHRARVWGKGQYRENRTQDIAGGQDG